MPLVISNVNYEDKDLDWFLDDNPLNKVLYARLVELDDSLDFDAIFNEAYKKCIRVYAEKHPERNCRARLGYLTIIILTMKKFTVGIVPLQC